MISWLGPLILAFAAGVGLGAFYFGSLWVTVSRLDKLRRPGLVMMGGYGVRTAVVLVGVYLVAVHLVAQSRWQLLLVCLGGFVLARTVLVRRYGPGGASERRDPGPAEASDDGKV